MVTRTGFRRIKDSGSGEAGADILGSNDAMAVCSNKVRVNVRTHGSNRSLSRQGAGEISSDFSIRWRDELYLLYEVFVVGVQGSGGSVLRCMRRPWRARCGGKIALLLHG